MTLNAEIITSLDFPVTTLREADILECWAGGLHPTQALRQSARLSSEAFIVRIDGAIAAYWGYVPNTALGHSCRAWCLTTPIVEANKRTFVKESKRLMAVLLEEFYAVYVEVDRNHVRALRWLKALGFRPINIDAQFITMCAERISSWAS